MIWEKNIISRSNVLPKSSQYRIPIANLREHHMRYMIWVKSLFILFLIYAWNYAKHGHQSVSMVPERACCKHSNVVAVFPSTRPFYIITVTHARILSTFWAGSNSSQHITTSFIIVKCWSFPLDTLTYTRYSLYDTQYVSQQTSPWNFQQASTEGVAIEITTLKILIMNSYWQQIYHQPHLTLPNIVGHPTATHLFS